MLSQTYIKHQNFWTEKCHLYFLLKSEIVSYFVYFIYSAFFIPIFIHMQNCPWYSEANKMPFPKWNTWKEDYFYFRLPVYFNLFADTRKDQQGTVLRFPADSKCKSWHPDLFFNRHSISLKIAYSSHNCQGPYGFQSKQIALPLWSLFREKHSFHTNQWEFFKCECWT